MAYLFLVPEWFINFRIIIELLFFIVAGLVSLYSFKIYNLSYQRKSKIFGIGFLLISISYLIRAIITIFLFTRLEEGVRGVALENLTVIGTLGVYIHMILFTLGLITILYTTFKTKCWQVYSLIAIIDLLLLKLSANKTISFYAFSAILIFYICIHYTKEYIKYKNGKTALIFIAFILLLLSTIKPILSNTYNTYVISDIMELGAYLLISVSLFLTFKKPSIIKRKTAG